jgi:hypothetical protein
VILRNWRSAFCLAARHASVDAFDIFPQIAPFCAPQADNANYIFAFSENQHMKTGAYESYRHLAQLTLILPVIEENESCVPFESADCREIDLVIPQISGAFRFLPCVSAHWVHNPRCNRAAFRDQLHRSYDQAADSFA